VVVEPIIAAADAGASVFAVSLVNSNGVVVASATIAATGGVSEVVPAAVVSGAADFTDLIQAEAVCPDSCFAEAGKKGGKKVGKKVGKKGGKKGAAAAAADCSGCTATGKKGKQYKAAKKGEDGKGKKGTGKGKRVKSKKGKLGKLSSEDMHTLASHPAVATFAFVAAILVAAGLASAQRRRDAAQSAEPEHEVDCDETSRLMIISTVAPG